MVDNVENLSRSASQHDHSERSCLRNQSSCSSLTSGIGQSDQSICNDRIAFTNNVNNDHEAEQQSTDTLQRTIQSGQQSTSTSNIEQSGTSEEADKKLRSDIKKFVDIIFTDSQSISLEKKAEFGQLVRSSEARLLFAMFVDDYRVNSKKVSELTFYSLAQYFSIVLFECLLAEDFRPAKIIMNMMFTYYYEHNCDSIQPGGATPSHSSAEKSAMGHSTIVKTYLYNLLKDQEIFKSIRFWTSAFYESVIIERNNHSIFVDRGSGKLSNEKRNEELDCSKNITFGLLGSFIHNMCLLDLSHEFCQEFLDKHSTIAGLSEDQLEMLRSNLKSMFSETSSGQTSISGLSRTERLTTFLQKLGTKLNHSSSQHPL